MIVQRKLGNDLQNLGSCPILVERGRTLCNFNHRLKITFLLNIPHFFCSALDSFFVLSIRDSPLSLSLFSLRVHLSYYYYYFWVKGILIDS